MDETKDSILIDGNTAASLGCLYAGATVGAWYPITPATSLMEGFKGFCQKYRVDPETQENRYAILGHVPYRRLIQNMVLWAALSGPPVRVEGLTNTELVTKVLSNDLIIHLITGMPQRSIPFGSRRTADTIEEQVPLYNVRLTIPPQTRQAKRVPQNEILPIDLDEDQTWITLQRVEDWETRLDKFLSRADNATSASPSLPMIYPG